MKIVVRLVAAAAVLFAGCGVSRATHILDLTDPPGQTLTPFSLTFTATSSLTTLTVGGYQKPDGEEVFQNALLLNNAGSNLLGVTWTFTPAPSGSFAVQSDDGFGSGTNGLTFGGVTPLSYDLFSQTIATTNGASYTYNFLYSNSLFTPNPSGFFVDVRDAEVAVGAPGPIVGAGLPGLLAGFGAMLAWYRNRRAVV